MNKTLMSLLLGGAALMAGCGGGSDEGTPVASVPVTEAVPAEAATSPDAAMQYMTSLTAVTADASDTLEPVSALPDNMAIDDTAEPKVVN